jgi:hypothetical protein
MAETQRWQALPTQLERAEFEQFVLPHLSIGSGGRHRNWVFTKFLTTF